MTVQQLLEALQQIPPDKRESTPVVVPTNTQFGYFQDTGYEVRLVERTFGTTKVYVAPFLVTDTFVQDNRSRHRVLHRDK